MDKTFTSMDLDLIISKSNYLQKLFSELPDEMLQNFLVAPHQNFIAELKCNLKFSEESGM